MKRYINHGERGEIVMIEEKYEVLEGADLKNHKNREANYERRNWQGLLQLSAQYSGER